MPFKCRCSDEDCQEILPDTIHMESLKRNYGRDIRVILPGHEDDDDTVLAERRGCLVLEGG